MLIRTQTPKATERKGVILLVVISLLTLFAIVALSFLLYANAEANASKLFREEKGNIPTGPDPEKLFNFFLRQFIYDVQDDSTGVYSGLRGYSLARGIYGLPFVDLPANLTAGSPAVTLTNASYSLSPGMIVSGPGILPNTTVLAITSPTQFTLSQPAGVTGSFNLFFGASATTPFNGTGKLHTGPVVYGALNFPDDYQMVNYTYFAADGFFRDPEKLGFRLGLTNPPGQYTGGFNAPYTYPDLNNMFLAAVKADGTVLMPSFHRHWLFNPGKSLNDVTNPNWGDPRVVGPNPPPIGLTPQQAQGKYALLRPRPVDQLLPATPGFLETFPPNRPYFGYPEDPGGDVRNLPPGPGYLDPVTGQRCNNDSIWMDLGAPVMTDSQGKKFKPLFAPLIIDLDNRVNLNVSGNVRGWNAVKTNPANQPHVSNQGWGPWEVNLGLLLNSNANPTEWTNLFLGNGTIYGRYGLQGYPGSTTLPAAPGGDTPHFYGQVDYDGCDEGTPMNPLFGTSGPISVPGAPTYTGSPYSSFPSYPPPGAGGYGNGFLPAAFSPPAPPPFPPYERAFHPLIYNYFQPDLAGSTNQVFGISNMEALLRYGDVHSSSDLLRLCPTNFQGTTSPSPWMPNPTALVRNLVTTTSFDVDAPGVSPWTVPPGSPPPGSPGTYGLSGSPASVPTPVFFPQGPAAAFPSLARRAPGQPTNGDFNGLDWRSVSATLGRINLNRNLTPYTGPNANPQQADIDRQQFAADIFIRLVAVTGVYDLFNNGPTAPAAIAGPAQFDALRWLAQLSANIVDFIDTDDVMTTFPWALNTLPSGAPNPAYQSYRNNPQYPYPQIMAAIQQFQNALNPPTGTPPGINADPIGQGWVVGTELPRVVINEAYAEFKTTPPETTPGTPPGPPTAPSYTVKVDVWAELHNPFNSDAGADPNSGNAVLFDGATSIYQVVLANTTPTSLRANPNVYGYVPQSTDPLYGTVGSATNVVYSAMNTGGIGGGAGPCITQFTGPPGTPPGTPSILPAGTGQAPTPSIGIPPQTGFFLVGPPTTGAPSPWTSTGFNQVPGQSSTNSTMEYTLPSQAGGTPFNVPAPTILLQRLMNPYAPPNPAPGLPFNPAMAPNLYVTVDYMQGGIYTTTPPTPGGPWTVFDSTTTVASRHSFGRVQPYTGAPVPSQLVAQAPAAPYSAPSGQPVNTFYSVNMPVPPAAATPSPFNWLTHLDRQLISPMELLNVSAFKPHELTQQFNTPSFSATPIPAPSPPAPPSVPATPCFYGHRAPWFDEDVVGTSNSHYLYRLFEFLETGPRAAGMTPGGRIPGKVNIGTVYDEETFQAICSALPTGSSPNPNYFDSSTVHNVFNALMQSRSPGLAMGGDGMLHPPVNSGVTVPMPDQPFYSLATGLSGVGGAPPDPQNPTGISINNTLMRWIAGTPPQPLLQVTQFGTPNQETHPYLENQLITKLFNNLTTRSNVFAVFVTVGFFEVTDSTTQPVKLGAEIGKADNRKVRHRMFAIIDRSSLAIEQNNPGQLSPPPVYLSAGTFSPPPAGTPTLPFPANLSIAGIINPGNPASGVPATLSGSYEGAGTPALPYWSIQAYQPPVGAGVPTMGTNLLIDTGATQELVNVAGIAQAGMVPGPSPGPPAGPPLITLSADPANPPKFTHFAPVSVSPVNTISAYTAISALSGPVTVTVSAVSGTFQGVQWSLQPQTSTQPGTTVMVDVGTNAEPAVVQAINANSVTLLAANPTGLFTHNHTLASPTTPGAYTLSYPIPVLGNPGPQPTFNARQAPWVVRYLSIIN